MVQLEAKWVFFGLFESNRSKPILVHAFGSCQENLIFTQELTQQPSGETLPSWVNRMALLLEAKWVFFGLLERIRCKPILGHAHWFLLATLNSLESSHNSLQVRQCFSICRMATATGGEVNILWLVWEYNVQASTRACHLFLPEEPNILLGDHTTALK